MSGLKSRGQSGFTLVELILYITIFSLIIGGIVGLITLSTSQRVKNQTMADLNYQAQAVLSLITQTIHRAEAINSPAPGDTSPTLSLAMSDPDLDPTIFDAVLNSSNNSLLITEGSEAVQQFLTNSKVSVSNLRFTNMAVGSNDSILIQFDLTYNNHLNRQEFDFSRSFSGGATIP